MWVELYEATGNFFFDAFEFEPSFGTLLARQTELFVHKLVHTDLALIGPRKETNSAGVQGARHVSFTSQSQNTSQCQKITFTKLVN